MAGTVSSSENQSTTFSCFDHAYPKRQIARYLLKNREITHLRVLGNLGEETTLDRFATAFFRIEFMRARFQAKAHPERKARFLYECSWCYFNLWPESVFYHITAGR